MRKSYQSIAFILTLLSVTGSSLFAQAPTLDGTITPGEYQQTFNAANPASNNQFGPQSDIRSLHIAVDANNLYIGLATKVEANGNPIGVWLGFSELTGVAAGSQLSVAGAASYMNSSFTNNNFRADFEVDMMFSIQSNNNQVNVTRLVGTPSFQLLATAATGGTPTDNTAGAVFANAGDVTVAFNNQTANDLSVTPTGFEMRISFASLGVTAAGTVQAFAFIAGNNNPFFSNIVIPGDAGTSNLGFDPNFGALPGGPFHTGNVSLPVELSSFSASVLGSGVELLWSTATETNNKGFFIERSNDGASFGQIGFVGGKGTTTESQSYRFIDRSASGKLFYRLKQVDFDGRSEFSPVIEVSGMPHRFALSQNYPNPFNPSTQINFSIPVSGQTSLKVFDVLGREVATLINDNRPAGAYSITFAAANLPSGMYFYRLQSGAFSETKRMMLVK